LIIHKKKVIIKILIWTYTAFFIPWLGCKVSQGANDTWTFPKLKKTYTDKEKATKSIIK